MIKIKLGIVDSDALYLKRLTGFLERRYSSQIEIYSFSGPENIADSVRDNRINVLAVSQETVIDTEKLADFCMLAYITDSKAVESYNGFRTVCRYQRADLFYRQILGLYSEKLADKVRLRTSGTEKARISLFLPVCEGAGAVTAAAAFAEHQSRKGKKTLFLNMRQFRSSENIFSAAGDGSFTDIIFAVKSRKINLTLKLESLVKQDTEGVYFFDSCKKPLDYAELRNDELKTIIDEVSTNFGYEDIAVVSDFYINDSLAVLSECADSIIMVSDAGKQARTRLQCKTDALISMEMRYRINLKEKLHIIFNRTKYSRTFHTDIPVLGIQPDLDTSNEKEIVKSFSASEMFNKLQKTEETV